MKTMLMTATVVLLSGALCSGAIYHNDFNEASDIAGHTVGEAQPGPYTFTGASLETAYSVSPDTSLRLTASGGGTSPGWFYHFVKIPLGAEYDFWAGGAGLATAQALEGPGKEVMWLTIELRHNDEYRAHGQLSPDNQGVWGELVIDQDFDGDETDINTIYMEMVGQKSGSGSAHFYVDDFLVIPEPATILMLVGGASMALRRRKRVA